MKKQLLFLPLLFSFFIASAQFKIVDKAGKEIKNGHSVTFNKAGGDDHEPQNYKLQVINTSNKPIYMKVVSDGFSENTDGSSFKMCFDTCYITMEKGSEYPIEKNAVEVTTDPEKKVFADFWNYNEGDEILTWSFSFQQYESARGKKTGTPISFTYIYDKNGMSVDKNTLTGVSIYPTVINQYVNIEAKENLTYSIYDFLGKKVFDNTVKRGKQKIDLSSLSSKNYLIRLTNNKGQSLTKKIVIK